MYLMYTCIAVSKQLILHILVLENKVIISTCKEWRKNNASWISVIPMVRSLGGLMIPFCGSVKKLKDSGLSCSVNVHQFSMPVQASACLYVEWDSGTSQIKTWSKNLPTKLSFNLVPFIMSKSEEWQLQLVICVSGKLTKMGLHGLILKRLVCRFVSSWKITFVKKWKLKNQQKIPQTHCIDTIMPAWECVIWKNSNA